MFMSMAIIVIIGLILLIPAIITIIVIACVKADNRKRREEQGFYVNGEFIPPKSPVTSETSEVMESTVTYQPPPPPRNFNASTIMLLIGTAFIVLAAITFVAANWVNMTSAGRVFALLAESGLAFGISALLKKVVKLNRTSIAFYMIGSIIAVISLITAGYYELLGSWFAVGGGGAALLYCASSLVVSASAFVARPIYQSKAFNYIGTSFVSLAIIFLCIQPSEDYEQFAPVIAMAQLMITAVIHLLKPQKNTEMEHPVVLIGDISAVVYQCMAFSYVFTTTVEPTLYTFIILAIFLAQCLAYGIFKHQKWLFIFFNLVGLYTGFVASFLVEDTIGESYAMLMFAFITLAFYIANKFIPNNLTACHVITLVGTVIGSIVSLVAGNENYFVLNLIVPLVTSVAITGYGLNKSAEVQTASGIVSPVLPFFTALFLNSRISDILNVESRESRVISFGLLVIAYIAVSAFFVFLPKINFEFYAKHPVKSQVTVYTNMICAVAVLLNISGYSQLFLIPVALCIVHFAVSYSMNCNITAVGSVASLIFVVNSVLKEYADYGDARLYIMFMLFVVLIVISRIIFPDGFSVKTENKTLIDVILLSSWTAVIPLPFFSRTSFFIRTLAIAVFLAGFIKRNTSKDDACVLLSFSSALACLAFMTRPFLTPDSSMVASKVNIAIFALLGVAYRLIWKNHKNGAKVASTVIFIISFASLIIDGITFDSVANKIFVLAVTAGVLVFSFFAKSKTWFIASSIALVVMTVFSTIRYFNSAGWWLYLLIVGAVFIVIASINEVCRKNGETMKSAVSRKFSDWTW